MSENVSQHVDTSSPEFAEGVETGLNSTKGTKNWQAGNMLGQELKHEHEQTSTVSEGPLKKNPYLLFTKDHLGSSDQDEKDETEE